MVAKRQTLEQIIPKLREAEVALARGATVGQVCKKLGVAEQIIPSPGPGSDSAMDFRFRYTPAKIHG